MTAEDRAKAIDIVREIAKKSPADGVLLALAIANEIRAAVDIERERCAKIAEDIADSTKHDVPKLTAVYIARKIRETE